MHVKLRSHIFVYHTIHLRLQDIRLLAIIVAKNAVGSSWTKTVATREWSRTPEEEKTYVRSASFQVLLQDPSERVALQAALLISNIARFDVPRPWTNLLKDLMEFSSLGFSSLFIIKKRALKALKFTIRGLRSKRFIIPSPRQGPGVSFQLQQAGDEIDADRAQLFSFSRSLLLTLRKEWELNFSSLYQFSDNWNDHGELAALQLSCIRELLLLIVDIDEAKSDFDELLNEGAQAAALIAGRLFTSGNSSGSMLPSIDERKRDALSKCWERLLQIALVSMDRHTVSFAVHIPQWANLCVETALLRMNATEVHNIRSKSRILLTRFVARALIQPLYRFEAIEKEQESLRLMAAILPQKAKERHIDALPALRAASEALNLILSQEDGRCHSLVQAVVSKYIIISPEELSEWENDPEGFARQIDAETSPDADSPRPCGIALLECMLERSENTVSESLISLASTMQNQPITSDSLLLREAVYRAIGECFTHLRSKVDFKVWYENELGNILKVSEAINTGLTSQQVDILKSRALWLVGVCCDELTSEAWVEAYTMSVQHIRHPDLVVSLMAVSATTAMSATVLQEQQFVSQPKEQQKLWLEGSLGTEELATSLDDQGEDVVAQADAEFKIHLNTIDSHGDEVLLYCFEVISRLGEAESMIRVLHCVTVIIELLGEKVKSHVGAIIESLPKVWEMLEARSGEGTGAFVRLFCSLLAMLAHLISKMGADAVQEPRISNVLIPLLHHSTDISDPQKDPLLDDGLKLWLVVLQTAPVVSQNIHELMYTRLIPILGRGRDGALPLRIAEAYTLLGGIPVIQPLLDNLNLSIASALRKSVSSMEPKPGNKAGTIALGSLTSDLAAEAAAAASLLGVLEKMYDQPPKELEDSFVALVSLVGGDYGGGVLRLPARSAGVMETCLDVLYRLFWRNPAWFEALTKGDTAVQDRILERWIALGSMRDVGELFIPSLGAIGRMRRHVAAVSLCALMVSDVAPGLLEEHRASQAIVLGLKAMREQNSLEADQIRLSEIKLDRDYADQIMIKRLELSKKDFLRYMDARDAVRAAVNHFASKVGHDRVLAALEKVDPLYKEQVDILLSSTLPENEATATIQSFKQTFLK